MPWLSLQDSRSRRRYISPSSLALCSPAAVAVTGLLFPPRHLPLLPCPQFSRRRGSRIILIAVETSPSPPSPSVLPPPWPPQWPSPCPPPPPLPPHTHTSFSFGVWLVSRPPQIFQSPPSTAAVNSGTVPYHTSASSLSSHPFSPP